MGPLSPFIDRAPIGTLEEEVVSEFQNVRTVREVWVRHTIVRSPHADRGLRIYLAHSLYVPEMMALGDRILHEVSRRNAWRQTDLFLCHLLQGEVQAHPDRPSRIWLRQEVIA